MAKDWTDSLRKKMDNYSETPGDEVWKGIAVKTGMAGRRRIPVWIPSLAAAAAVVAGVFLVTLHTDAPEDIIAVAESPANVDAVSTKEYAMAAVNENFPERSTGEKATAWSTNGNVAGSAAGTVAGTPAGTVAGTPAGTVAGTPNGEAARAAVGTASTKITEEDNAGEIIQSATWTDWEETKPGKRRNKGFTIGLGASGSGKANGSLSRPTALAMGANPLLSNDIGTAWTATALKDKVGSLTFDQPEVQTAYSHRIPVKIGLTARYYIGRFGIETGLDYSILTSGITTGEKGKTWSSGTQTLQYLGIPLNASFNLLDKRFVTLYLSAGGEMEKCVKGKTKIDEYEDGSYLRSTDTSLKIRALQWSVNAAAGLQVNILPNLGAYVEPGVVHHFVKNSRVRSSYTDRPTDFSLRFGLRYSFGL
ncbi:MAG: outer membrane beta-barrel protein [Candidatus Cryptobacteroides sp.]